MFDIQAEYKKVEVFEQALCNYTGSKYCIAVDCCTNAIFLCLAYYKTIGNILPITLPNNTFIGVVNSAHNNRYTILFKDYEWVGMYKIDPYNLYDSARRLTSNMYISSSFMCLSFHYNKHLKIGRGGAILLDDIKAYEWFKLARNNGKDITKPLPENTYNAAYWNMLLHPDLAEKGTKLLHQLPLHNENMPYEYYGDLRSQIQYL